MLHLIVVVRLFPRVGLLKGSCFGADLLRDRSFFFLLIIVRYIVNTELLTLVIIIVILFALANFLI